MCYFASARQLAQTAKGIEPSPARLFAKGNQDTLLLTVPGFFGRSCRIDHVHPTHSAQNRRAKGKICMLWPTIKAALHGVVPESEFGLWIKPLECRRDDEQGVELVGPDRFFCAWVEDRYLELIRATAQELLEVLATCSADLLFRKASSSLSKRGRSGSSNGLILSREEIGAAIQQLNSVIQENARPTSRLP